MAVAQLTPRVERYLALLADLKRARSAAGGELPMRDEYLLAEQAEWRGSSDRRDE